MREGGNVEENLTSAHGGAPSRQVLTKGRRRGGKYYQKFADFMNNPDICKEIIAPFIEELITKNVISTKKLFKVLIRFIN